MNTIFGTVLRAVGAVVSSTVSPLSASLTTVWAVRPAVAAAPAVKPPVDLDPYSELEKGRLLEWWILVADK
jgi:hypothetical protein